METQAFRDAVPKEIGLAMEPGADALFDVAPEKLYLTVNEQALGAWNAILLVSSVAEDRLTSAVVDTLADNSKIKSALGECAVSGYGAAAYVSEAGDAKSAFDSYLDRLGLASGVASCTLAVDEYILESRSAPAHPTSTVDDLLSHSRAPAFVNSTMEPLHNSWLARFEIALKNIVRVVGS